MGKAARILAIDDTPANLATLGAALASEFDLQIATSGAMGLTLAEQSPPNLILLDIMMPEMDGYEVCRRLKADPQLQEVPVVFVTALDEIQSEVKGLTLGAADYILKPINVGIARQRIRNILERERMHQEVENQRNMLAAALAQQEQTASALRDSYETLHSVLETTLDGYWQTDRQGRLIDVNPAYCQQSGYRREELLSMHISELDAKEDATFVAQRIQHMMYHGREQFETRHRRKDGSLWPVEVSTTYHPAGDGHIFAFLRDISERKRMETQVQQLAFNDPLTGLPNRRLLTDRLSQVLANCQRSGGFGALLFLDLDNFKPLNDCHGHEVGDLLLIEVGQRLNACVRESDTVARFGGDEFVVMLSQLGSDEQESIQQAGVVAEKIRQALAAPYRLTVNHQASAAVTVDHQCTTSIGVVTFGSSHSSGSDLLKWADAAMYKAKEAGRNRYSFYVPETLHSA